MFIYVYMCMHVYMHIYIYIIHIYMYINMKSMRTAITSYKILVTLEALRRMLLGRVRYQF